MKRQFLLPWILAAIALCNLPASAQFELLPSDQSVPVPTTATSVSADNFLNPLHQEAWVVLSSEGRVTGQFVQLALDGSFVPVSNLKLIFSRNATSIMEVSTDAEGRFAVDGLAVGTYGLVGRSERSIAALALHVLPAGASAQLDSDFVVYGTTMNGPSFNDVVRAHTVPGGSAIYPDFRTDPLGEARRFGQSKVQLREGGLLAGRVSKPAGLSGSDLTGNVVHILRNGIVVGHEPTNARGEFKVPGLSAGVYDMIIAGKDGIAAGSFQAIAPAGVVQIGASATRLVATQASTPDSLNVELVPTSDFFVGQVEEVPPVFEDPGMFPIPGGGFAGPGGFPGGGGGGFGGGGGGGLGGIGGLGGLLGIGGLAAGIAALAADDDGFDLPPASVIIP